jgi:hypothetical protein
MDAADPRDARSRAAEPAMSFIFDSVPLRGVVVVISVALASPVRAQVSCSAPQKPMLDVELLLGRSANDARWREFLAREVTPRFPDGLTVYETYGQWRDSKNTITRERSRVLRIIVAADPPAQEKIAAVAEAYKKQFRQKSVGVVTRPACVSF